ncbi:MAG TPA: hypothetical protein VMM92_03320 [Thermoanaerobaculia bacterium]|nr:hypothetical protein [Thermoanaerobaculia bacterium]
MDSGLPGLTDLPDPLSVTLKNDAKPFVRGVNSFELFSDGKRWWIFSIVWQPETAKLALPAEFLP